LALPSAYLVIGYLAISIALSGYRIGLSGSGYRGSGYRGSGYRGSGYRAISIVLSGYFDRAIGLFDRAIGLFD